MPNWKKLIVSGSDASLNTLNVQAALTASGLNYPNTDGSAGQAITTDGNGNLTFNDATSPDITGSSLITASISGQILTFTKGDTSTFNVTIPTSGGGSNVNLSATAHLTQSVAAQTWSFQHDLDDRIPVLTVFDSNHDVIIPERIEMVDEDNMKIYFSSARTGYASAAVMGVTSSYALNAGTASYVEYSDVANKPTLLSSSLQIASDISGSFTDLSSSLEGRVSNLEDFSSSLDATFATDEDLNLVSSSVDSLNAATSSYALKTEITGSFTSLSSSIGSDIEDIIDGTTTITSASYAISASYALTASHAQNLTISGSIAGVDYIDFSTTSSVPHNEGRLFYDQENGSLGFYNEETEITLQIGQEFYKRVYNNSGGVISNGTPVRISGSQGDYPYVWPAVSRDIYSGSYDAQENKIVGIATHNIGINEVGYVTELGVVRGVDTTAFAAGDRLYLQTGSAGFRNTPPPFPFDIIPVGEVLRSQSNGFIEVRTSDPITHKNISGVNNIETQVINDESVAIQRGTPVHVVSEGNGPVPRVKIAKANDSNLMPATFVVEDEIPSGSQGTAVSIGYIYDVDTSAFTVGDVIYVAPNGGYTNQKPTGSDLIQNLGVVLKVSATEGSGFVYGAGRSNDVPNILEGYAWVGNSNQVATATATSSFFVTSGSHALNADTSSYIDFDSIDNKPTLLSGSAQIAEDISGSFTDLSSSLASELLKNTTDTLDGDLTVTGTVTAQEFHTEFVSSSIIFESGSTLFGNSTDDTHIFSGSLQVYSTAFNQPVGLNVTSNGRVGIGAAAPSYNFDINPNVGNVTSRVRGYNTTLRLQTYNSNQYGRILFATDLSEEGEIKYDYQTDSIHFKANQTDDLLIISSSGLITGSRFAGIFEGALSSSAQIASDISGSFTDLSSSLEGRVSSNEGSVSSLNSATSSYALKDEISGSFTDLSSSLEGRISNQEDFSSSLDATFATDSDLNLVSSSVDSLNAATSSYALKDEISGSITSFSSSIAGRVAANESFSSSLDTTLLTLSGSFSGSFVGDGSQLSGVTSYTDADTLSYINTLGVVSGSEQIDLGSAAGTASHAVSSSYTLTASYAENAGAGAGFPFEGDAVITGSFLVSGSFVDLTDATVISGSTFSGSFVGDGTGLSGLGYGDTKKLEQTSAATTWSFSHNMNEQFPTVTVYNDSNEVIQPTKIEGVDAQTLKLYFGVPTAGTAVAVVGGTATTQEAGFNRVLSQTSAATTWSFAHNLGNKYPQVIVYDSNDEFVLPGKVEAVDQNNLNIYFDTAQSGTATATVGGTSLTASYADSLVVSDTLLTTGENTDVDTGTETVATVSTTYYDGAFFDYVAKDGTNYRAGTVMAVWDGSSVQYNDNSTADIGDTSGVTLAVDISGTDARLRATVTSDNWNIKAFVRAL